MVSSTDLASCPGLRRFLISPLPSKMSKIKHQKSLLAPFMKCTGIDAQISSILSIQLYRSSAALKVDAASALYVFGVTPSVPV
jgi:hypothetical protein